MSKLVMTILGVSSLFLVGLSIAAILLNQNPTPFKTALRIHPTPTITTLHSLTLAPHHQTIQPDKINIIDIILETQNNTINKPRLLQMEIAYDPNALLDIDIVPGDFFNNPIVSLKTINSNTGRISYAIERSATGTTQHASGVAARLTFTPNPLFTGSETALSFLGKTIIRGTTDDDMLTATYGTKLFFATASAATR